MARLKQHLPSPQRPAPQESPQDVPQELPHQAAPRLALARLQRLRGIQIAIAATGSLGTMVLMAGLAVGSLFAARLGAFLFLAALIGVFVLGLVMPGRREMPLRKVE